MLPELLELIYETSDRNVQHTIVVVGEPSSQALASVASNITIHKFADVEREGVRVEKILSPIPSMSLFDCSIGSSSHTACDRADRRL